jgi:hypothetical protein
LRAAELSSKQGPEIFKCSVAESKTVFVLERKEENNKVNTGSRTTSPLGNVGSLRFKSQLIISPSNWLLARRK